MSVVSKVLFKCSDNKTGNELWLKLIYVFMEMKLYFLLCVTYLFSPFCKTSSSLLFVFSVIVRSSPLHLVAGILLHNVTPVTPVKPVAPVTV